MIKPKAPMPNRDPDHHDVFPGGRAGRDTTSLEQQLRGAHASAVRAVFTSIRTAQELGMSLEDAVAAAELIFDANAKPPTRKLMRRLKGLVDRACGGAIEWEKASGLLVTRPLHPKHLDRRAYYTGRCLTCGEVVRQVVAPKLGQKCRKERP